VTANNLERFHEEIRQERQRNTTNGLLGDRDACLFDKVGLDHPGLWQMHLASSSIRLPLALERTIRVHPAAARPFGALWTGNSKLGTKVRIGRWDRIAIMNRFPSIRAFGCSDPGKKSVLSVDPNGLKDAIVVVLLHRDEFAHGEVFEGQTRAKNNWERYFASRGRTFRRLSPCRVVEAQQVLIDWALDRLLDACS
jgi:hypothetical protein